MQDSSISYADRPSPRGLGRLCRVCLPLLAITLLHPTLAAGADRYSDAAARMRLLDRAPNAAVLRIGESPQGRPIYAVLLGRPERMRPGGARMLVMSGQHGNEISPVYAMLDLAETLAHERDPELAAALGDTVVAVVPVVNPDGFAAGRRHSSSGADLNRNWQRASCAETRAVAALVGRLRPQVIIDLHEWMDRGPAHTDCVEVPGFGTGPQRKLARLLAAFSRRGMAPAGGSSGMRTVFYRRESDSRLAHRHFANQGICGMLVETAAGRPFEARKHTYRQFVEAALITLGRRSDPRIAAQLSGVTKAVGRPDPALASISRPPRPVRAGMGDVACWILMASATAFILARSGARNRKPPEAPPAAGRQLRVALTDVVRANLPLHERLALIQQQRVRPSDRGKQVGAGRAA